jgi:hypothetical protein
MPGAGDKPRSPSPHPKPKSKSKSPRTRQKSKSRSKSPPKPKKSDSSSSSLSYHSFPSPLNSRDAARTASSSSEGDVFEDAFGPREWKIIPYSDHHKMRINMIRRQEGKPPIDWDARLKKTKRYQWMFDIDDEAYRRGPKHSMERHFDVRRGEGRPGPLVDGERLPRHGKRTGPIPRASMQSKLTLAQLREGYHAGYSTPETLFLSRPKIRNYLGLKRKGDKGHGHYDVPDAEDLKRVNKWLEIPDQADRDFAAKKAVAEVREHLDPRSIFDMMEFLIRTQPREGQLKKRKKKKKKKKNTIGKTKKKRRQTHKK